MRKGFKASDLEIVRKADHDPIVIGDLVRLASGSPVGIVRKFHGDRAEVSWFNGQVSILPWMCFDRCATGR